MTNKNRLPLVCLGCGLVNDGHQGPESTDVPEAGDVSVCFTCGALAMYDVDALGLLTLRLPTDAELADLEADPQLQTVRHAIAESYTGEQAGALWQGDPS